MKKLHIQKLGQSDNPIMLTKEDNKKSLECIIYLKKKCCGKIKFRGCVDGRNQIVYKMKEETSSTNIEADYMFLYFIINSKHNRYVDACDIPWSSMKADMN